ncbi:hypothetical protein [Xanthovirga aplysinae]|uniref:hypothetical protein n=1 Tax=Xanthovirga aplysinae TaxID=2529853 RepID=UPI00165718DD|nr:hypothetical protein [Xanthovirga aplysinae]MTI29575.1 hypothetical protein [Xanthovirga aplysinae]
MERVKLAPNDFNRATLLDLNYIQGFFNRSRLNYYEINGAIDNRNTINKQDPNFIQASYFQERA